MPTYSHQSLLQSSPRIPKLFFLWVYSLAFVLSCIASHIHIFLSFSNLSHFLTLTVRVPSYFNTVCLKRWYIPEGYVDVFSDVNWADCNLQQCCRDHYLGLWALLHEESLFIFHVLNYLLSFAQLRVSTEMAWHMWCCEFCAIVCEL